MAASMLGSLTMTSPKASENLNMSTKISMWGTLWKGEERELVNTSTAKAVFSLASGTITKSQRVSSCSSMETFLRADFSITKDR